MDSSIDIILCVCVSCGRVEVGRGREEVLGSRERRHEVKEDVKVVTYVKTVLKITVKSMTLSLIRIKKD